MPNYKYKAMDANGQAIEANYSANSKNDVVFMLRERGAVVISVDEAVEGKSVLEINLFQGKPKMKDVAVFCRQFHSMLYAGVTILNCLDILRYQTENKMLRKIVAEAYEDVQKGLALSEALRKHKGMLPDLLVNMIEAGEASGRLDAVMERMSIHFEKETKMNNKVKGAMVYPTILAIVATLIVTILLIFVLPTFIKMFESSGTELPLPTRIVRDISNFTRSFWYIIGLVIAALVFSYKKYSQTDKGRIMIDTIALRIPFYRDFIQKVVAARFTRTLSTLLASGLPLIQALDIVAKVVGNKVVADGILNAKEEVRKGIELAVPIKKMAVFPRMVESMVKIGEESGSLDDILSKTANFYDDEVEMATQALTTMLEPLMIIVMGVVVGGIVVAMMLPMFELMSGAGIQ